MGGCLVGLIFGVGIHFVPLVFMSQPIQGQWGVGMVVTIPIGVLLGYFIGLGLFAIINRQGK